MVRYASEQLPGPASDFWYKPVWGSAHSNAGVRVTEDSALSCTAVLQAVRLTSEMIATQPFYLLENTTDKNSQPVVRHAEKHPLYKAFLFKPNPIMTAFQFVRMMVATRMIRGNFYAHMIPTNGGGTHFWPLQNDRIKVIDVEKNDIAYQYTYGGTSIVIPRNEMLHISGFGLAGVEGRGIIKDGVNAIGGTQAAADYGNAIFKNGGYPGGALRHPRTLTPQAQENLRDAWMAGHGGVENAHRVAILLEGVEWVNTGIAPKDAQLLELRQFDILEIARLTNVPPHLLMDMTRTNMSNVAELARQWLVFGLGAIMRDIELVFRTQCFPERDWLKYEPRFDTEHIQRPDMKSFYETLFVATGRPMMSVNEARARMGLGAIEGEDTLLAPLNMGNAGGDPALTPQPLAPKVESEAIE